ncbi:MAG TPA: CDP-alcohol phosphatidyltransferase family protein [Candidatus Bathyarchaeota archaeon]|nr:CDP-alcohol phosphatidyltransferase family protein [Candidatus Bathyarchaeota archaeon]
MPKGWDGIVSQSINRKISRPMARLLAQHTRAAPNQISVLSLAVSVLSGLCFFLSQNILGGILAQASSILDGVDGDLAVLTGKTSVFGGFFDSVLDRYGDFAILIGMTYSALLNHESILVLAVALIAVIGTFMVSYSRTRAKQSFGITFKRGISGYAANRDVRLLIIMIGGILNQVFVTLVVLAVLTNIVVIKRVYDCWKLSTTEAPFIK